MSARKWYHFADGSMIYPAGRNSFGGRWIVVGPESRGMFGPRRVTTDGTLADARMLRRELVAR